MEYFERYVSNTLAGSGNQHLSQSENPEVPNTGRVFYKIFSGGTYNYSFLFTNIIDSTFAHSLTSHKNVICDQWNIESLKLGICDHCDCQQMAEVGQWLPLTFGGSLTKTVMPGEFFYTDPVRLDLQKDQYICLELQFSGKEYPDHPESMLPMFVLEEDCWVPSKKCRPPA